MTAPQQDAPAAFPARLVEGYKTFLSGKLPGERARFESLAASQSPKIMLIGCCDSRVAPEVIFDASPGEIFVLRNVAALVPPYRPNDDYHGTSAAIEFGVMGLRVEHIVVMGHASCGGVKAYAESVANPYARPLSAGDFIGCWMKLIAPAMDKVGPPPPEPDAAFIERLSFEAIRQTIDNLRSFPYVRNLEQRGMLNLHGAYFGVADGRLMALDDATGKFTPVAARDYEQVFAQPRF